MKLRYLFGFGVVMLSAVACGSTAEVETSEDVADSTDEAISVRPEVVGGYDGQTGNIVGLALKKDGSFFYEQTVYCIKAPCPPIAVTGKWTASKKYLYLTLQDKSQVRWGYTLSSKGILTLKDKSKVVLGTLKKQDSYCRTTTQCEGQSYPMYRCIGYQTCDETTNLCGYSCGMTPCATVRCAAGTECVAHPSGTASCEATWSGN